MYNYNLQIMCLSLFIILCARPCYTNTLFQYHTYIVQNSFFLITNLLSRPIYSSTKLNLVRFLVYTSFYIYKDFKRLMIMETVIVSELRLYDIINIKNVYLLIGFVYNR